MTVIIFWGYRPPPSPLSSPITHPHMRVNRDKTAYRWRPFANRDCRSSTFTLSVIILSFVNQNYLKWKLRIVFCHHIMSSFVIFCWDKKVPSISLILNLFIYIVLRSAFSLSERKSGGQRTKGRNARWKQGSSILPRHTPATLCLALQVSFKEKRLH